MELLAGVSAGTSGFPVRALDASAAENQSQGRSSKIFSMSFMGLRSTGKAPKAGRLISGS
jgi:hypothetical protein